MEIIFENKRITEKAIANKIGISDRAVRNVIKKLKDYDVIKRVGGNRGGHWEINTDY